MTRRFEPGDITDEVPAEGYYPGVVRSARWRESERRSRMIQMLYALSDAAPAYGCVAEYFVLEDGVRVVDADATLSMNGTRYTVPSALANRSVAVRIYAEHVEVLDPQGRWIRRPTVRVDGPGYAIARHGANIAQRCWNFGQDGKALLWVMRPSSRNHPADELPVQRPRSAPRGRPAATRTSGPPRDGRTPAPSSPRGSPPEHGPGARAQTRW